MLKNKKISRVIFQKIFETLTFVISGYIIALTIFGVINGY